MRRGPNNAMQRHLLYHPLDRRRWLQSSIAVGGSMMAYPALAQTAPPQRFDSLSRQHFPRMLQEWYVQQVRQKLSAGRKQRAGLRTPEDAERYVHDVREKIRLVFGPFPERTPLQARITGRSERDDYAIENVVFESRPGFLVTANLYLPRANLPAPGVVGTCGHSIDGKMAEPYQSFAQGLARQGYVVLIYDPIGQGERLQYLDDDLKPIVGGGVNDHLLAGNQQYLVGEFFGMWRAWDGIRALDYLLTRPEVDPRHVGVTGNSGGGTMTTWLCGLDRRWTMAAPACFVTSFLRNLENELPADTEQCPPRAIELGLDHLDFLAAMAPKPVILLAKEGDYFDVRGSEYAYRELQKIYRLLGAAENIALFIGPGHHGLSQENREAMYAWFHRVTGRGRSDGQEPRLTLEAVQTLRCAPQGQVKTLGAKTVFDFTGQRAAELAAERKKMAPDHLMAAVDAVLRLPDLPAAAPPYRILRPFSIAGQSPWQATPYAVQTEPGIHAVVYKISADRHYARPRGNDQAAALYVAGDSAYEELRQDLSGCFPIAAEARYACDVRGIGESRPNTCGGSSTYFQPYGNDYFYAAHGVMLGRSVVAQRTWDILRTVHFLRSAGHPRIHLAARHWAAIPATFAALLDPSIVTVHLWEAPESFTRIAQTPFYQWPLSSLVPGILQHFDLPDCYRHLKATKEAFHLQTV
ncbi:MAG: xylan esterase [Pirellulaceae bacterium]|nr:MAG: xylan esterase [Pirellulaceae bacterium]